MNILLIDTGPVSYTGKSLRSMSLNALVRITMVDYYFSSRVSKSEFLISGWHGPNKMTVNDGVASVQAGRFVYALDKFIVHDQGGVYTVATKHDVGYMMLHLCIGM